jgi:hypothetical protein
MTGGAERSQMLIGVSGIVVAAGGKARGRLSLIHAGPAVVLVVNMEPMLSGRQPGELWRDHQAIGAVYKTHHPQGAADSSGIDRIDRGRVRRCADSTGPNQKKACQEQTQGCS